MYTEDYLLPISGVQHLLFCKRQCALIYIEGVWLENRFTAEGRIIHERVHEADTESRGDVRVEYAMPIRSLRLGLVGKADVVEFHRDSKKAPEEWRPFPVEYKRGKQKKDNCDEVQLCAQALCLEEMLKVEIPSGALFYGKVRRRQDIDFDTVLRRETENAAKQFQELVESGLTPRPVYSKKCERCSMYELCLPKIVEEGKSVDSYLMETLTGE